MCYHFYNHQPNIGETLRVYPDDDPMSFIHDRYAIAVKTVGTGHKIEHVQKFMSKFTYYFLRHGGVVRETVLGERQYSWDLQQGSLQIPTLYNFSCGDHCLLELFKTNVLRLLEENMLS